MDKIIIEGGQRLQGEVSVSGSKNAALPILMASLLATGESVFTNVPQLQDIISTKELLTGLGVNISFNDHVFRADTADFNNFEAPYDIVRKMRASILVLGPIMARLHKARVSLPGGCAIGARPIDLHLKALEQMGAEIELEHGYVNAKTAGGLKGAEIYFDVVTVTGTENIMMAATLAKGRTVLRNAACEPEIVALGNVLIGMGADIQGLGTSVITINGVDELRPAKAAIMSDRIEAGTIMAAAIITKGDVLIKNCCLQDMEACILKLTQTGGHFEFEDAGVRVRGGGTIISTDVVTQPHPGFPTDMQAQFMALMCLGNGTSTITETIFENRFIHVSELQRMGADISIAGNRAVVTGKHTISGAPVMATDLRASASLILAGLVADGITEISRVYHLDRGYEKLEEKFRALGANIQRIKPDQTTG